MLCFTLPLYYRVRIKCSCCVVYIEDDVSLQNSVMLITRLPNLPLSGWLAYHVVGW